MISAPLLLIARILLAAMFLASGYSALSNIAGTADYFAGLGLGNLDVIDLKHLGTANPVKSYDARHGCALELDWCCKNRILRGNGRVEVSAAKRSPRMAPPQWGAPT